MTFDTTSPWGTWKPNGVAAFSLKLIGMLPANGFFRKVAFLLRKPVKNSRQDVYDREIWGLKLRLAARGNLAEQRWLTMPNFHDAPEREALRAVLHPGAVFLDVGAKAGFYTFWALSQKHAGLRVIAVESTEVMLERVRHNLAANNLTSAVTLYPCAVTPTPCEVSIEEHAGNVGQTAVRSEGFGRRVSGRPLLDLLQEAGVEKVDAMKIDIEGFEVPGLEAFFNTAPCSLWPHFVIGEIVGEGGEPLKNLLISHGYRLDRCTKMNGIFVLPDAGPLKRQPLFMSGNPDFTRLGQALPESCGVCVINLHHRKDRWEDFEQNMLPHLVPLEVHRISAVEGVTLPGFGKPPLFRGRPRDRTWAARAGCALSHRAALMRARDACWSHVLVLEDDIQLPRLPDPQSLFNLRVALSSHDPDICYLGFTDPVPPFRELTALGANYALHQVFGCNTAHAYIVSSRAIAHLLEILPQPENIWHWLMRHRAVDRFYYRNLSPKLTITAVSPCLIEQKSGFSDILGRNVNVQSEMYNTTIDTRHPDPADYEKDIVARASAFTRDHCIDLIRGWWKSIRGF